MMSFIIKKASELVSDNVSIDKAYENYLEIYAELEKALN